MLQILNAEVVALLTSAGWSQTRFIDVSQLLQYSISCGFHVTPRVNEIMSNLGLLKVKPLWDGTQVHASPDLVFEPDVLTDKDIWDATTGKDIGCEFFPIAYWGPCSIILASDDRVFAEFPPDYLVLLGSNFEDALETILLARRMPQEIERTHTVSKAEIWEKRWKKSRS